MTWLTVARAVGIISFASVVAAPHSRTARSAGLTFDYSTTATTQPAMGGGAGGFSMTGRGSATSVGSTRIDVVAVDGVSSYRVGDYILVLDGHSSLVHPDTKTFVDLDANASGPVRNLPPAMAQATVSGVTGDVEKVGGDEQIDGRSAEHHRIKIGYAMNFMSQALPYSIVTDLWLSKLPFKIALVNGGAKKTPPAGPMAETMLKYAELVPHLDGFTMMKSSSATTVSAMGQTIVNTIAIELKNVKEGDVDVSRFVLPADYTKSDK